MFSIIVIGFYFYNRGLSSSGSDRDVMPSPEGVDIPDPIPVSTELVQVLSNSSPESGIYILSLIRETNRLGRGLFDSRVNQAHLLDFYNSNLRIINSLGDLVLDHQNQISLLERKIAAMEIDLSDGVSLLNSLTRSLNLIDSSLLKATNQLDSLTVALSRSGHSVVHSGSFIDIDCTSKLSLTKIETIVRDYYQGVTNSDGILPGSSETVGMIESVLRDNL